MTKEVATKEKKELRVVRYFRETWFELRKVVWPTRREALNLTLVVIMALSFLAIVLSLMDWVFSTALGALLKLGAA